MIMDSFEIGDVVSPVRIIRFMDGTVHLPNTKYVVKSDEIDYYHINGADYRLVKDSRVIE